MDLVVLDDPLNAFDESEALFEEIGFDRLLHVDRGPSYRAIPLRRAAHRVQAPGSYREKVRGGTDRAFLTALARSNLSFFVNESLAARKGLKIKSDTDPGFSGTR